MHEISYVYSCALMAVTSSLAVDIENEFSICIKFVNHWQLLQDWYEGVRENVM